MTRYSTGHYDPSGGRDYCKIARGYAENVCDGKIVACKWVKLACKRQLDDLKRQNERKWPYRFDEVAGNRICSFVEGLPHIKGEWARRGEKLKLEPWQIFIYTTVFGWLYKRSSMRRFRTAYDECGRKNSKSTMSAPVGLYMLSADDEMGAEVYSAATNREQARIVWDVAKMMAEREPDLRHALGIDTAAHSIFQKNTASKFIALHAEGSSLDGLNVHCGLIDELHAHPNRKVYDVIETARGSRQQPLLWIITTAGSDQSGICYEQRNYLTKVLEGSVQDDSYFGIIYTLDDEDDWQDEKNWIKPNPNLDVSVDREELRRLAAKAKVIPAALNNFLTKHMCQWVTASTNLFNITQWQELADPDLQMEDFKGVPCWIGLDFAPRNDFSAVVMLFKWEDEDGTHFYVFARHFLSEGKVAESENASYSGWVREGWIETNTGNQTSVKLIADKVVAIANDGYQIQEVNFDPSRVQGMQELIADQSRVTLVDVPQQPSNLCPAAEYLSALIADKKIHHNGNPLLAWELTNVVGKLFAWGLYPIKEREENKIDGVTALLTALCRAMVGQEWTSIYASDEPEPSFVGF